MNTHTQTLACPACGSTTVKELLPVVKVTSGLPGEPVLVQVSRHLYCQGCEDWRWIDITATAQAQQVLATVPVCHDLPAEELIPEMECFSFEFPAQYIRRFQCRFCDRLIRAAVYDEREEDMVFAEVMFA